MGDRGAQLSTSVPIQQLGGWRTRKTTGRVSTGYCRHPHPPLRHTRYDTTINDTTNTCVRFPTASNRATTITGSAQLLQTTSKYQTSKLFYSWHFHFTFTRMHKRLAAGHHQSISSKSSRSRTTLIVPKMSSHPSRKLVPPQLEGNISKRH